MTIELSTEELAQELARRQQADSAEQERRADALREAQDAHARHVLNTHQAHDARLIEEGREHQDAAVQALRDLDLNAAFAHYTKWKATRIIRSDIRTAAQNAAVRLQDPRPLVDIRDVLETFNDWVARETSGMNRPELLLADGRAEELLGAQPLTYEDLEANHGN